MKIKEFDTIVLNHNLPEHHLKKGDLGTVVMIHKDGKAYEVEFMTLDGRTIAVETLSASKVRPVNPNEVARARMGSLIAAAAPSAKVIGAGSYYKKSSSKPKEFSNKPAVKRMRKNSRTLAGKKIRQ